MNQLLLEKISVDGFVTNQLIMVNIADSSLAATTRHAIACRCFRDDDLVASAPQDLISLFRVYNDSLNCLACDRAHD